MTTTFTIGVVEDTHQERVNTEDGPFECFVTVFCIVATSPQGHVFCLDNSHVSTRESAEEDLRALTHDPASRPELWRECDPVYGSEAWGPEQEYELACLEADAFDEPRPRWF